MMKAEAQVAFDAFQAKFRVGELGLCRLGAWTLSLRPHQATFASMVLSASTPCPMFSDLPSEGGADLQAGLALAERLACGGFGAVRLNVLCLMLRDPHLHFHILPRYDAPVSFGGKDWHDEAWPAPVTKLAGDINEEVLLELRDYLRSRTVGALP